MFPIAVLFSTTLTTSLLKKPVSKVLVKMTKLMTSILNFAYCGADFKWSFNKTINAGGLFACHQVRIECNFQENAIFGLQDHKQNGAIYLSYPSYI